MSRKRVCLAVLCALVALITDGAAASEMSGVRISELPEKLRVEINGKLFTEYVYQGARHVYYYPLLGPGELAMTRSYPMVPNAPGEAHDHKHHRSLWFSHGRVNGIDFWSEGTNAGKIVHEKFLQIEGGPESGIIRSANKWVAPDGMVACRDERTFRVYARPGNEQMMDFEVTLKAGEKEVVLGDTKEGTMAIRIAESMRLSQANGKAGQGHIVQSTGVLDQKTWGKRAKWCDYYGPVQGRTVGIAIFDHPQNPNYPTWWHVRDYGLFAANPFGVHDFEKKPDGTGELKIAPGGSATLRYRVYCHEGDTDQAKVEERYREWIKSLTW